jgi:hypothetical protein
MKKLSRLLLSVAICCTGTIYAQEAPQTESSYGLISEAPVIEHRADRVLIFPQRMHLDDNTTVMDLLAMFPEALSRNYENLDDKYVVRVENFNYEANIRVFLSTLRAKYVEKIQICDNPDVMKGSKSLGGVIDINMIRGAEEKDIYAGAEFDTKGLQNTPVVNAVYGNGKTDVLLTASLSDNSRHGKYDALARCAAKINTALNENHNLMYDFAARYGHSENVDSRYYGGQIQYDGVFNDAGTALCVSADVEYYDDGAKNEILNLTSSKERTKEIWQVYIVELWTPIAGGLELCAGWELDYATTNLNSEYFQTVDLLSSFMSPAVEVNRDLTTYNNDFYAQFDYTVGALSLTLGDRVMCYHYGCKDEKINNPYNLIVASATLTPNWHHQIQGSYYRRFVAPDYIDIHSFPRYNEMGFPVSVGNPELGCQPADVYRMMYTYSSKKFQASAIGRYIDTRDIVTETAGFYSGEQVTTFVNDPEKCKITNIDASFTYTPGVFSFVAGASVYNKNYYGNNTSYEYIRFAPALSLPSKWKISAQALWCSDKSPEKIITGADVYGMFSVQKGFGKHLTVSAQWHDMFCGDLSAANFRVLYYF